MNLDPLVINVYADALFGLAKRKGMALSLTEQTDLLATVLETNTGLRAFLEGPHVPTEHKIAYVEKVFRPHIQPVMTDFMLYLVQKNRIEYLGEILKKVEILLHKDQGILPATITTAVEISGASKADLKTSLETFSGKQFLITYEVDSTILGGAIFNAEDLYIDHSLRGYLDRLREKLGAIQVV